MYRLGSSSANDGRFKMGVKIGNRVNTLPIMWVAYPADLSLSASVDSFSGSVDRDESIKGT